MRGKTFLKDILKQIVDHCEKKGLPTKFMQLNPDQVRQVYEWATS